MRQVEVFLQRPIANLFALQNSGVEYEAGYSLTLARTSYFAILEQTWGGWLPPPTPKLVCSIIEIELRNKTNGKIAML